MKTKMILEVEVDTQFGPYSAVGMMQTLLNYSAIKNVTLVGISAEGNLDLGNKKVLAEVPKVLIQH